MTTIAWDGTTLAADSCSWSGSVRRKVRKVFKVRAPDGRQFLIAFAGSGSFAQACLSCISGEIERPAARDFIKPDDVGHQCAVVIGERGEIWQMDYQFIYSRARERIYAYGAGQEFAWGALEMGATAAQAVRIAAKRSDYAGFGVDCVRF